MDITDIITFSNNSIPVCSNLKLVLTESGTRSSPTPALPADLFFPRRTLTGSHREPITPRRRSRFSITVFSGIFLVGLRKVYRSNIRIFLDGGILRSHFEIFFLNGKAGGQMATLVFK